MHRTLVRGLAALAVTAGLAGPAAGLAAGTGAAATTRPQARHVVLVGIGGLRWSDVSPTATPALWRLARAGSIGSLAVSGIRPRTCPADGWLTLNGAARAVVATTATGACPAVPAVASSPVPGGGPAPARVPAMAHLESVNTAYSYQPDWGLLGSVPPGGGCATAVGPGAALALADRSGRVSSYLPGTSGLSAAIMARCPLTVIDMGSIPAAAGHGNRGDAAPARSAALRAADRALAGIVSDLPPATALMVATPGNVASPHLGVIVVAGPGLRGGLLTAPSTRQAGLVTLTDLTPTIAGWLGGAVPGAAAGTQVEVRARGGDLADAVAVLRSQDRAAQVYRDTLTPFFLLVGIGYAALFALVWAAPWGRGPDRRTRRRSVARAAAAWAAAVPAGTFLASLVPWWSVSHPAAVLYGLAAAWAVLIAVIALTGPWRRDPLGPAGVVATITFGVIALDLVTGSHLQRETPFGFTALVGGRFYGLANNSVVIYAAAAILSAAWAGSALIRRGRRSQALAVMGALAAFAVIAAGWPGFGAKVGGTIAMVPGLLVLLAAAAGARITARRAALIAVSGLVLVVAFALVSYFLPVGGQSDITGFVGKSLHGGAGAILHRKVSSNLGSLTANPAAPVVPVVLVILGIAVAWPARVRAAPLAYAYTRVPLLKAALSAIWLTAVLGWFAEDSGVTVPAAGLPLVLPLAVLILSGLPRGPGQERLPAAESAGGARRLRPARLSLAGTGKSGGVGGMGEIPGQQGHCGTVPPPALAS